MRLDGDQTDSVFDQDIPGPGTSGRHRKDGREAAGISECIIHLFKEGHDNQLRTKSIEAGFKRTQIKNNVLF